MRARGSRAAASIGLALALAGCKAAPTRGRVELADDIDAIERALAERGAELEQAGAVLAYRDVREPTPTAPTREEQLGDGAGADASPDAAPVTPTPGTDAPPEPNRPTEVDSADAPSLSTSTAGADLDRESVRERRRSKRGVRQSADEEVSRCDRLWGLADATCGLRTRVCALAGRHLGDIRYAVACRRAEDQCAAARELYESCSSE